MESEVNARDFLKQLIAFLEQSGPDLDEAIVAPEKLRDAVQKVHPENCTPLVYAELQATTIRVCSSVANHFRRYIDAFRETAVALGNIEGITIFMDELESE